jgi:hypothetical protein
MPRARLKAASSFEVYPGASYADRRAAAGVERTVTDGTARWADLKACTTTTRDPRPRIARTPPSRPVQ